MSKKLKEEAKKPVGNYSPDESEKLVLTHLQKRIPVLKDTKKNILGSINFERLMQDADKEYQPSFLTEKGNRSFMFIQDELTGLRGSRVVAPGTRDENDWRSNVSAPTLFVKIQTALSILVDQNPQAVFKASSERHKKTTDFAYSLWKRSWQVARSKHQLKLFIFDLAKYGFAIGRTYPRIVKRKGEVLEELDVNNPENNKYSTRDIIEFNDVYREKLDPYRTWIDDMTNLTDPWSMDDWYFEKDYSLDTFNREFGQYKNSKYVVAGTPVDTDTDNSPTRNLNAETKSRDDIVTVGFYESKNKDLYAIYIPKQDIVVYSSPLPNDDKKLSVWWSYWNERDPRTPYGIGLYEIIKHNKILYDRLNNMSIDQLTMAIYPMLFYSGPNQAGGGTVKISPFIVQQKNPGTTIDQVNIKYDGRGFDGALYIKNNIDEDTGITPTLQGEIIGKTLGETLHAKESALKRLNIPLDNIAQTLEEEAYISLSWMKQVYSTPEVLEYKTYDELQKYLDDTDKEPVEVNEEIDEETGETTKVVADFYPSLELSLDEDSEGNLVESPEDRFFRIGIDVSTTAVQWEGKINVEPQSILSPSIELDKQRKTELYNLIMPNIQVMQQAWTAGDKGMALALYNPTMEILEVNDERAENWLPAEIINFAESPELQLEWKAQQNQQQMLQAQIAEEQANPLFVSPEGNKTETPEVGGTVVGKDEVTNPVRESLQALSNYSA